MGVRAAARASTARPSARRPAAAATLATTTHAARSGLPSRKTPSHPLCHDGPASPVTPEVAGSSPVAPAPSTKALHSGPSLRPGWALLTAHGLARDYATEPVLALVAESMQRLPRSGVVFLGRPPDSQDPTTQTSLVERVDDVAQGRLVGARHRRDPRRRHARQGRQQDDRLLGAWTGTWPSWRSTSRTLSSGHSSPTNTSADASPPPRRDASRLGAASFRSNAHGRSIRRRPATCPGWRSSLTAARVRPRACAGELARPRRRAAHGAARCVGVRVRDGRGRRRPR